MVQPYSQAMSDEHAAFTISGVCAAPPAINKRDGQGRIMKMDFIDFAVLSIPLLLLWGGEGEVSNHKEIFDGERPYPVARWHGS